MKDRTWDEISEEAKRASYADWRKNGVAGSFPRKEELIRSYARHLLARGEKPTRERIEEMLEATGRGYARSRCYMSRALRGGPNGSWGDLAPLKLTKGGAHRVIAGGEPFHSIRAAAEAHGVAVETVRKRIRAGRDGWGYAED